MSNIEAYRPVVALADDDEIHAECVSMWLDMHGFDVVRFTTGDALVEWAAGGAENRAHVDAILLDVEMPGRDGFATHAELRRIEAFTRTPVLFVSGMCPEQLTLRAGAVPAEAMAKDSDLLPRLTEWLTASTLRAA